nr:uncharacterized protein LOC113735648 [Coffea arabica]
MDLLKEISKKDLVRETDLKDTDTQDSPAGEVNDRDTTTPNDLPRTWKFIHNHPRELIIGDPSEKMEGQNYEGNIVGGNEEPEQATQGDETDEGNIIENQQTPEPFTRKSPRTRTEAQNVEASATQTSNRKRSGKAPVSQPVEEPTHLPKFIDDEARDRFENLLVPPIPENNANVHGKEPRPEPTGPTTGTETTPASCSQPKDQGKAPTTEEAYEDDDEETEEEEVPEQFRLARKRPRSSKITI